jgi:transcriptional regulator with XRE-family HTH domain
VLSTDGGVDGSFNKDKVTMISQRLRQLRLARGLTLDGLAAAMGGMVTKQALSKYENGTARPAPLALNQLARALGVKAAELFREPEVHVRFIAYRSRSSLAQRERERLESLIAESLEERVRLQARVGIAASAEIPVQGLRVDNLEQAEQAASQLRALWQLGLDPIANVVGTLEDQLVHVIRVRATERFDGISAIAERDEQPVAAAVATRVEVPGERERLSLAHELGHLVLSVAPAVSEEKAAFRFAGAFLAPAAAIRQEVGNRRAVIHPEEMLLLKRRFGVSIQALVFRLYDLGIINKSHCTDWRRTISTRGWRKHEPAELAPESPQWLRRTVLHAVSEGLISQGAARRLTGEDSGTEFEGPLPLVERRNFLGLPLEERRRILAEQAEVAAAWYDENSEWREIQGGDTVE